MYDVVAGGAGTGTGDGVVASWLVMLEVTGCVIA
jgi:hypothetical protein